jgi:DNA-binding NarL/FixJ family response regulator
MKFLVAEDVNGFRAQYVRILQRNFLDAEIIEISDRSNLEERVLSNNIDLAIIGMGKYGSSAIEHARKIGKSFPIIYMTPHPDFSQVALDAGANDTVIRFGLKPEYLMDAVRKYV